ncbi:MULTISPECIES: GntR family transcriptional regulator [Streptomyces]|uniref:GntR family transcriptional regulator n=1 Tax=Streptomyces morookaense TaxID=1970 RepID=A0A7Y7AZK3_STRMO|nr:MULTISPECIES: GntR family transcriptional regulator [Streptomyces]MCC2276790.1 GntR family transcriptional regulator [Streptomyces sp. ET3-23]NVK76273.1 GntR family transcriptional regulator [Streptomyces morookaense]GHF38656.1 GntR family transcriptional regulator [Streptomyces morookaense]
MEQGRPHAAVPAQADARGEHVHEAIHEAAHEAYERPARRAPQRYSVRGQVLDALRKALVSGELVPGEVYSGPVLGERFGVSATPVREAMQQLALEGAVEVVPNRGFRVASRTDRDLAELAEVRALLEIPAVLRLAGAAPAGCWAGLRPLAERAAAVAVCGDRAAYAEADRAFHGALLALAGNRQLVLVAEGVQRRVPATDLTRDAAEHLVLLDALASGDVGRVEDVLRRHVHG